MMPLPDDAPSEPQTPQTPSTPQTPNTGSFQATTYEIEGTTGFEFNGIPAGATKIEIYWGENSSPFEEITLNKQSQLKTEFTWDLSADPRIRFRVLDANGTEIGKSSLTLK